MIALYHETDAMRGRIEGLLADAGMASTECRKEFLAHLRGAWVGIADLKRCSESDVAWLLSLFGRSLSGPSCVVVAPLSIGRLRRLRRIESNRFHVVWREEADVRLERVLERIEPWYRDPMQVLGRRLLCDCSLHWSLARGLDHMCRLSTETRTRAPKCSVSDLASCARVPPDAFRRYWKRQVPLRCSPKQLLRWSVLLWAVRERSSHSWETISRKAGVRRRTLERYSSSLTGRSLAVAALEPVVVRRRFEEWLADVSVTE